VVCVPLFARAVALARHSKRSAGRSTFPFLSFPCSELCSKGLNSWQPARIKGLQVAVIIFVILTVLSMGFAVMEPRTQPSANSGGALENGNANVRSPNEERVHQRAKSELNEVKKD